MPRYQVPNGRALKGKKVRGMYSTIVGPVEIDPKDYTEKQIAGMLQSGFLVNLEENAPRAPERMLVVGGRGQEIKEGPDARAKLKTVGKWTFDPKALEGKTLEQLNVMAAEIDPAIGSFEDPHEARIWLSQDFQG